MRGKGYSPEFFEFWNCFSTEFEMCDLGQNWIELISVTMLLLTGFHAFLLLKSFSLYWNIYYLSLHACMLSCFNHARLFVTLWTVACQAALPMGFSRQECWSDCCALLQGTFPTQGLHSGLLLLFHWQADSLPPVPPAHLSSVIFLDCVLFCPSFFSGCPHSLGPLMQSQWL